MSNDIDIYSNGGELQPYAPSQPLAPTHDDWGIEPDYASDRQQHSTAPVQLFGNPLPPGATAEHVERALGEIAGVFTADMSRLNHPMRFSTAAVAWLQQTAMQPPRREQKRHNYNLHDQAGDPVAESFGNAMAAVNAPQEFVSNALWWIQELERRQNNGTGHDQPTAMDGNPTSIDQLSDAQYERVVQLNAQLQLRTMDTLSRKWGRHMVHANIALAQKFLDSLPEADQRHFDQYLQDWTHNLNHAETLEFLYGQAIGAGSLPTSSAGIVQEIAQIESVMGTAAYRKDERMQARYRELVTIRDRGR